MMTLIGNFNPRSPRGERLSLQCSALSSVAISIHAPREGSDRVPRRKRPRPPDFNPRSPRGERPALTAEILPKISFQSTLPARGATLSHYDGCAGVYDFNPRSPRGERHLYTLCTKITLYFNPRSPRGERRAQNPPEGLKNGFQSTLPARGAT